MIIFIIKPDDIEAIEMYPLSGVELFTAIRNEVYRWEYLMVMEDTETDYMGKLLVVSCMVQVVVIKRPQKISLEEMRKALSCILNKLR